MLPSVIPQAICRFLCVDMRFGKPGILDDQCWAIGTELAEPKALSLLTTYGLRASRMHVFPQFSMENLVIQDPARFSAYPVVSFSSTCLVKFTFSPFPSIDVEYRVWVPHPQVVVGQMNCLNTGQALLKVVVDWRVHLQPLQGGSPMKHAQAGLNTIMQGECANLRPVFYLTGGAMASLTDFPGLGNQMLLMPGTSRQVTWALASLTSVESSTQQARQFSSSALELEQIKIEMADKGSKVHCTSAQAALDDKLQHAQDRTHQLLMPPLQKHTQITYVANRSPDLGYHVSESILDAQPEWNGQTLPEIYLLAHNLLPGRPEALKGLLQNFLNLQQPNGRIDLRASVNHTLTGHSSLPMLASLVSELQPYLDDFTWLRGIYPQLLAFLKTWVVLDDSGSLVLSALTHPLQLGFNDHSPDTQADLVELWFRLAHPRNLFLVSLLYREVSELLRIGRVIEMNDALDWLEQIRARLAEAGTDLLKPTDRMNHPSAPGTTRLVLASFHNDGFPRFKQNLPHPGKICLRLDYQGRLPAELNGCLTGFAAGTYLEKRITAADFQPVGSSFCYVPREEFEFIESISVKRLPEGARGEISLVDQNSPSVFELMACYAGFLSEKDSRRITSRAKVKSYLTDHGLAVFPVSEPAPGLLLPSYLAAMVIDGLVRYGKFDQADQLFQNHFLKDLGKGPSDQGSRSCCSTSRITELAPTALFLRLHGLMKLSNRELVIRHYDGKQPPVTVQYNQLELLLKHHLTEIHLQSGEVIYLNQPGTSRIILE